IQIPIQGGRGACSFHASRLVAVLSHPPVVLDAAVENATAARPAATEPAGRGPIQRPKWTAVEDFLSPPEYRGLLAWALEHQTRFAPGTVGGERNEHRENKVILDFGYTPYANLLKSRLLTWFPLLCRQLEMPTFPLKAIESQLTAANDGQYYRLHDDASDASVAARELTCVYYFHNSPRAFSGGELRLFDAEISPDGRRPAPTFQDLEPAANRLVVFPSDSFHEVRTVHCPSRDFADSRFAVTHWLHRRAEGDREVPVVWGEPRDEFAQLSRTGERTP
ncbi:MAG: 2OG-Fe(II) oxygenase, partial [Acidobacteriota bacterium]